MVNEQKIEGLFRNLQDYVSKLRDLSKYSHEDFLNDFTKINSAKYLLQVSIECCLNISTHIISSGGLRAPKDYVDTFKVLNENGIIPDDFLLELQKMARFRNRIVHLYWEVDDKMIHEILQDRLSDFDKFTVLITQFLEKTKQHPKSTTSQ